MRILKPSFEIIKQEPGLDGIFRQIEISGRNCYKSEDKITKDSSKAFVNRLIKSGHLAMLEHATVYLHMCNDGNYTKYIDNKYSEVQYEVYGTYDNYCYGDDFDAYITTNYRVLVENGWLDDLQYLCEPTKYHEKRVTVKFSTQIAISREFNRHRVDSAAESSTRYCNYSKDKFGNEITISLPFWVPDDIAVAGWTSQIEIPGDEFGTLYEKETFNWNAIDWWVWANSCAELAYMKLIKLGKTPEEARTVLPLDTNTDLIHTAFIKDWEHFFDLRSRGITGKPHPDAKFLADGLLEEFKHRKYV